MKSIEVIASGKYLPRKEIYNSVIEKNLNLPNEFIFRRTGIRKRFYVETESIKEMAINSVKDLINKSKNIEIENVQMIIVATTTTDMLMPGVSFKIQQKFGMKNCMCLDILSGCAGFINAFDIAEKYVSLGVVKNALIIGVDILSKYMDKDDVDTKVILSDGAGAVLIEESQENKMYKSKIESNGKKGDILTCKTNEKIYMNGKEIYKYAVTETAKNIKELINENNLNLEDIKYIVPHQSNMKIIKSIANRLDFDLNKIYVNLENIGNTFCASIPIALDEMFEKNLLNNGDKVILIGYGGGLNTGSILLEV